MGFASLGSGSRGNGTLVFLGEKLFLVDCGFSLKQAEKRLARLGVSGGDIDGIFVTHEHADHISGVVPLSHKYKIPIYASFGAAKSLGKGGDFRCFDGDKKFELEGIWVNPVSVPHDAREATQFTFSVKDERRLTRILLYQRAQQAAHLRRRLDLFSPKQNKNGQILRFFDNLRLKVIWSHIFNCCFFHFLHPIDKEKFSRPNPFEFVELQAFHIPSQTLLFG